MDNSKFIVYLLAMAGVTYLVRMLPLVLIKEKITNRFVLSFLHYVPYTVLSAMTVPAIFFATGSVFTASVGFALAIIASLKNKSLVQVAVLACAGVLAAEGILKIFEVCF